MVGFHSNELYHFVKRFTDFVVFTFFVILILFVCSIRTHLFMASCLINGLNQFHWPSEASCQLWIRPKYGLLSKPCVQKGEKKKKMKTMQYVSNYLASVRLVIVCSLLPLIYFPVQMSSFYFFFFFTFLILIQYH